MCKNTVGVPWSDLPVVTVLHNHAIRMKVRLQPAEFVGGTVRARQLTTIIQREDDGYVALCPELDIASQGDTAREARANLVEAVGLFLEVAPDAEIHYRLLQERL